MSLHIDYHNAFNNNHGKERKLRDGKIPLNLQNQVSTLEHQMARANLKSKKKEYKFQKLTINDTNEFIDNETRAFTSKKKSWSALPIYLQWSMIENYLKKVGEPSKTEIENLKSLIKKKELHVHYNQEDLSITKLNFHLHNGSVI